MKKIILGLLTSGMILSSISVFANISQPNIIRFSKDIVGNGTIVTLDVMDNNNTTLFTCFTIDNTRITLNHDFGPNGQVVLKPFSITSSNVSTIVGSITMQTMIDWISHHNAANAYVEFDNINGVQDIYMYMFKTQSDNQYLGFKSYSIQATPSDILQQGNQIEWDNFDNFYNGSYRLACR